MNKNLLIVGGTSGIGLEIVQLLSVEEHHRVVCACRHPERLANIPNVEAVAFDAEESTVRFEVPKSLDGVVYCPGTIKLKPFHRLADDDFRHDFEINLLGAVRILRHFLPALKKGTSPSILLFSSVAVQTGIPYHTSVAASKGAVEGLVRALAAELAPGIRVNGIAPSLTETPLAQSLLNNEEKRQAAAKRHPLNRIGSATECARLATFLLGDESAFATGQIYKLDGGLSALKTI